MKKRFAYDVLFIFMFGFFATVITKAGEVTINEIAWMGTEASTYDEWIELYNNTDTDIDLTDWVLEALDGSPSITITGIIPASGYFLLERSDENTVSDITADMIYSGSLSNSGECLMLKDTLDQIVDTVDCTNGWFGGESDPKISMERKNPLMTGSDTTSWASNDTLNINGLDANGDLIKGTPKEQNSVYEVMTSVSHNKLHPECSRLSNNYPNPFNPATKIKFMVSNDIAFQDIQLTIYNTLGQRIKTLLNESVAPGEKTVEWDGTDYTGTDTPSGLYFYRLETKKLIIETKRMVKLK